MPSPSADEPDYEIEREDGEHKGRYVIRFGGHEAEMTYSKAGASRVIIDHTGVPDALRGRGLAALLVERGVADARREGKTVIPLCAFAKAYIARRPALQDVLGD